MPTSASNYNYGGNNPIHETILLMRKFFTENFPHDASIADTFVNAHFSPLVVKNVDIQLQANREANQTDDYDNDNLIVRRGGQFSCQVALSTGNENLTLTAKQLKCTASLKDCFSKKVINVPSKPNSNQDEQIDEEGLWCNVESYENNVATVVLNLAPDMPIGMYQVCFYVTCGYMKTKVEIKQPLSVLFNPFCDLDDVYMEEKDAQEEFVLNENGFVYQSGSQGKVAPKAWAYDQFDGEVFDCCLYLVSLIPYEQRSSPVLISRAMSALVNANDDNGVLCGNWSGNYADGVAPFVWNGSQKILSQYYQTKESVRYGQCWVFAGVLTTVMRCIGIPCRPVTNYSSAHDGNANKIIEFYYDGNQQLDSSDSIWNFHVWNEVWMKRKDLPAGRDGWQAIDATPQESSDGLMQMGPASLVSIQKGETTNYDANFVIAEVNADIYYYRKGANNKFEISNIVTDGVGKMIVTKSIGTDQPLNITNEYKLPEGSISERRTMLREATNGSQDYELKVDVANFQLGQPIHLVAHFVLNKNATKQRKGTGQILFYSRPYHGRSRTLIKTQNIAFNDTQDISFQIDAAEYQRYLNKDAGFWFQCEIVGIVDETKQMLAFETNFELELPVPIQIKWNTKQITKNTPADAVVTFTNPFNNMNLTNGTLTLESVKRFMDPMVINVPNIPPSGKVDVPIRIVPKRPGKFDVTLDFDFNEIKDVTAYTRVVCE